LLSDWVLPIPRHEPLIMSLQHAISIPPFHEKFICWYVPIKSSNNVLFTPNSALQHTKLVLILHAILHIRDYHGIISIITDTHRSKIMPCHTSRGFISQSNEQLIINIIHKQTTNNRSPPSISSSLVSCTHCAIQFCSEQELYQHLFSSVGINCSPQQAINTGDHPPLATNPRRISSINRQIINDEVKKMSNNRIIIPSTSPWASPVVIVKKHDGSPRFYIAYRKLNSLTQKDIYPLPRIDDVIERLNGSYIFSKIDLRSGYFQVPLINEERNKTAFITHDGLWHFKRLPQGVKNFPSVFQRLMNKTLGSLRWDACVAYLDDIVIYSRSFNQHLIGVSNICQTLHESNF
ncbi:unnamed protein product, partial [Rotaria magnacalcarata]